MYLAHGMFVKVDDERKISRIKWYEALSKGWDIIVPGNFGGDGYTDLLFYNRDDGNARFFTTNGEGVLQQLNSDKWSSGIDIIVPGNFGGSSYTDLMMYGRAHHSAYYYTTEGDGKIRHLHGTYAYAGTWDKILPGNFGGNGFTDLFFYDQNNGDAAFYTTSGQGTIDLLKGHKIGTEWDIIVPGNFGGSRYTDLFLYSKATGKAEFRTTDGQGGLSLLKRNTLRTVWDVIIPGQFGSNEFHDLFFYDRHTGETKFVTTDGGGNLSEFAVSKFRRGWRIAVPGNFESGGRTAVFLYGDLFPEKHELIVRLGRGKTQEKRQIGPPQEESHRKNIICQVQKYQISEAVRDHKLINLRQNVIWPGAIIDGSSIVNGEYRPITPARKPMRISVSLRNVKHPAVTVENPTLSYTREKINQLLLQKVYGKVDSIRQYDRYEIYSEEQLLVKAGISFDSELFKIKGEFDYTGFSTGKKILAQYIQAFYTIDVDPPEHPKDWFSQQRVIADDEMYVASVTYGRLLYFSFESNHSIQEMRIALDAAFAGGTAQLNSEYRKILIESNISVFSIGGDGEYAVAPIINGAEGLAEYLREGSRFDSSTAGLPIYYSLKYVKDNTDAYASMTTTYYERNCFTSTAAFIVHVKELVLEEVSDASGDDLELYGGINVRATQDDFNTELLNRNVWGHGRDNWVRVRRGVPMQIDETVQVEFSNIHKADERYKIQVLAWLKDYDNTGGNDDLGYHGKTIPLRDLTPNKEYKALIQAQDHATGYISFNVLPA